MTIVNILLGLNILGLFCLFCMISVLHTRLDLMIKIVNDHVRKEVEEAKKESQSLGKQRRFN